MGYFCINNNFPQSKPSLTVHFLTEMKCHFLREFIMSSTNFHLGKTVEILVTVMKSEVPGRHKQKLSN